MPVTFTRESQGQGAISTYYDLPISASVSSATGSVDVSNYNNHTVQFVISGFSSASVVSNPTGSLIVQSSLDGVNWFNDISTTTFQGNTSSLSILTPGRRKYIRHLATFSGNTTGSVYQISGQ